MKLSKKTRYGIRALMDLAASTKTEQVALNSIAQRNAISVQFLEQVFSALKRARLVRSVKAVSYTHLIICCDASNNFNRLPGSSWNMSSPTNMILTAI